MISFTTQQLWAAVLAMAGAIVTLSAAVTAVSKLITRARKPNADQNLRLDKHERWLSDHDKKFKTYDEFLHRDNQRIERIEEGNRVTQRAMLALLSHALDGNNTKQLEAAKESLQQYLINR